MPQVELTDKFCQSAKPGAGRKTDYFDTTVKGLCLRASAGGAASFFLVFTKPGDGGRAWLKLGRYPELKLAEARKKARDARAEVGEGIDPLAEKRAHAASATVSDLVENYIARHASALRSGPAIGRRLRKNVGGVIGNVKLADLHRRDVTRCIDAVTDRGAGVEANRVFEDLRAMLRWARGRGDVDESLVDGMRRPTETEPRDRVLDAKEIATIWTALVDADMRESTRRIVRLCLVTGQRVGEIAGMMRVELDIDAGIWRIPAERAKNKTEHAVPLSAMALGIIQDQIAEVDDYAERKGRAFPPFVFPGTGARAATTGQAIARAVKREASTGGETIMGVAPWTPHDLRRTMATHMEELGISPIVIGHVLNHASITKASITSRVYARYDYAKEKREALDAWTTRLQAIIGQMPE